MDLQTIFFEAIHSKVLFHYHFKYHPNIETHESLSFLNYHSSNFCIYLDTRLKILSQAKFHSMACLLL